MPRFNEGHQLQNEKKTAPILYLYDYVTWTLSTYGLLSYLPIHFIAIRTNKEINRSLLIDM